MPPEANEPDGQLRGLAQQTSTLRGQQEGLRAAVDSGEVVLEPDAAEGVAKVWEDKADEVRQRTMRSDEYIARGAYGECHIGRAMDRKMADKIEHPEFGAVSLLREMERIMRDMATTVRAAARETRTTDEDNARRLDRSV